MEFSPTTANWRHFHPFVNAHHLIGEADQWPRSVRGFLGGFCGFLWSFFILPLWLQYSLLNTSSANSAFHCKSKQVHNQGFVSARTGGRIFPSSSGLGSLRAHLGPLPWRDHGTEVSQHSPRTCSGPGRKKNTNPLESPIAGCRCVYS